MSVAEPVTVRPEAGESDLLRGAFLKHLEAEPGARVLMRNMGGYVARFRVKYTLNGKRFTKDSGRFSLGVNRSVDIPAGATRIKIEAEEFWGFGWADIFTKRFDGPVRKCYRLYGTTLDPRYSEMDCP